MFIFAAYVCLLYNKQRALQNFDQDIDLCCYYLPTQLQGVQRKSAKIILCPISMLKYFIIFFRNTFFCKICAILFAVMAKFCTFYVLNYWPSCVCSFALRNLFLKIIHHAKVCRDGTMGNILLFPPNLVSLILQVSK